MEERKNQKILADIRETFDHICSFISDLGRNSYREIELGGVEYEVGTHLGSEFPYEIFIPHHGTLYYEDLQSLIPDLFRLAMGDKWVEEVDWS